MKVLVLNCGSSSLKYLLFDMEEESVLAQGLIERIGIEGSVENHYFPKVGKVRVKTPVADHHKAVQLVIEALLNPEYGVIRKIEEIAAVGHRVVHGGERFSHSVIIDGEVIKAIRECIELAPLHNPSNIMGIEAAEDLLPQVAQVAVFDTAFHQTMPPHAFLYGLPYELYEKYKIRKYGFHGTSHQYVAQRGAQILGRPLESLRIITCHLGNGCSMTTVKEGRSIETSMGFTPLEGLIMGTRSGDIDPAIVFYLMEKEGYDLEEINDLLNKKSGLLGLSGVSNDLRDIIREAEKENKRAKLALDVFTYRIKKYIGAYSAVMGGVDVVIFTAGIGENSPFIRAEVCKGLEYLGIKIDPIRNDYKREEKIISPPDSKVTVMVIPTNEELMIARETMRLIQGRD